MANDAPRLPRTHPDHQHDDACAISCNTNRDEAGLPRPDVQLLRVRVLGSVPGYPTLVRFAIWDEGEWTSPATGGARCHRSELCPLIPASSTPSEKAALAATTAPAIAETDAAAVRVTVDVLRDLVLRDLAREKDRSRSFAVRLANLDRRIAQLCVRVGTLEHATHDVGTLEAHLAIAMGWKQRALDAEADLEKAQGLARVGRPPLTHVAIRFDGKIWSLPRPYRHHDVLRMIAALDPEVDHVDSRGDDQGFLDASGRYLARAQAEVSADVNGQIKSVAGRIIGGVLTSEDLW